MPLRSADTANRVPFMHLDNARSDFYIETVRIGGFRGYRHIEDVKTFCSYGRRSAISCNSE